MRTVEDVASRMASVTAFSTLDARSGFWQIKLDYECSLLAGRHLESSLLLLSFERFIEELFAGYLCVIIVYDLLVWGEGTPEHDGN